MLFYLAGFGKWRRGRGRAVSLCTYRTVSRVCAWGGGRGGGGEEGQPAVKKNSRGSFFRIVKQAARNLLQKFSTKGKADKKSTEKRS